MAAVVRKRGNLDVIGLAVERQAATGTTIERLPPCGGPDTVRRSILFAPPDLGAAAARCGKNVTGMAAGRDICLGDA